MATQTWTSQDIVNMALRHLGHTTVPATFLASPATELERKLAVIYPLARDTVQADHPWNFCTFRMTLQAWTEPDAEITLAAVTGTNISVTADGSVFEQQHADDAWRIVGVDGGEATITTFASATQVAVDIDDDFPATGPIAAGDWQLWAPAPPYEFSYRLILPADWLRVYRPHRGVAEGGQYDVEGDYVLSNETSLNVRVIRRVDDPRRWTPHFCTALVAYLTAEIAEKVTGQLEKGDSWLKKYQLLLRQAKARDGQEGTPEQLRSNVLLDARRGVRTWV